MAEVKILLEGFTNADSVKNGGEERTSPTITLVQDGNLNIVCDPGVVSDQKIILEKLNQAGLSPDDIDIVFLTHSHIDHFRNIGMFPKAKTLEYYGIWKENTVSDWQEYFSANIRIIKTPGHSKESLTMLVKNERGIVAICGDVFWKENFPVFDEYADNMEELERSRKLVLGLADFVIPGHGNEYKVLK
jgi:glyoxylase-like metal-dependent hydrolase (beta-lactamase superfamily II)